MTTTLFRNKKPDKHIWIDGRRTRGKALKKLSQEQHMMNAIREMLGLDDLWQQGEKRATQEGKR